jgi:TatD DNase family protein
MKYSAEAAAYKPIIRNSGKYIDIDEAIANAKAVAKKEFDGTDLIKAEQGREIGGVMHCFTEDWDIAKACLDENFMISISGIVTFKNAKIVQEVASKVPLDRLLIETDSPYLAPMPHRGKSNHPAFVKYVAEYIANLRGIPYQTLADATTANFYRLFGIHR